MARTSQGAKQFATFPFSKEEEPTVCLTQPPPTMLLAHVLESARFYCDGRLCRDRNCFVPLINNVGAQRPADDAAVAQRPTTDGCANLESLA